MYRADDFDRRLISLLRRDGRAPVATIATELGVSRATVTSRLNRLTNEGVIVGFSVRVRDISDEFGLRAICLIEVEGRTTDHVIKQLRGHPEITALHTTNGGWDLVAELQCDDLRHFDETLRRIRGITGVVNSETSLLLNSVVR